MRGRRDMAEGAPVVRHERFRAQSLEQREGVFVSQVPFAEARLPPRRVADGQEREVELAAVVPEDTLDEMMSILDERGIAGEKDRLAGVEEIHVRVTSPPVVAVPIPAVRRACRMDLDVLDARCAARPEIDGVLEAEAPQPLR